MGNMGNKKYVSQDSQVGFLALNGIAYSFILLLYDDKDPDTDNGTSM